MLRDLGLLVLRATVGGLLAGHGAQKLAGWFGGGGLAGTSRHLEGMGLRPGRSWALLAGASEAGGGLLTLLGLLNPVGPLAAMGAMLMATFKIHAGRPIWVTEGGAELPVTNLAAMTAVTLAGPGRLSADRALGIRLPRWIALPGLGVVGGLTLLGLRTSRPPTTDRAGAEAPEATSPARLRTSGDPRPASAPGGPRETGGGAGESDLPNAPAAAAGASEAVDLDAIAAVSPARPD